MNTHAAALALATSIAPLLAGWTVEQSSADASYDWVDLVRADGARVHVYVEPARQSRDRRASGSAALDGWRNEGRVKLIGAWPRFRDGSQYTGGERASITVGAKRPPKSIAREFLTRLLPAYDPEYAKARAYVVAHNAHADEAQLVAKRLAASIGGELSTNVSKRDDSVTILRTPEAVSRLRVQPAHAYGGSHSYPVRVDFEVHGLDPETAARVLEIIRESEGARVATTARVQAVATEEVELESGGVIVRRRAVVEGSV